MNVQDVIANAPLLYARFPVSANLQFHLKTVAAVGAYIADHWRGPAINRDDLVAYLLLHDLGNIAKMNFANTALMTPEDKGKISHWKQRQQDVYARYGRNEHDVTMGMARELDLPPRILWLLEHDDWHAMDLIAAGNDWEQKIGKYADYRVAPSGVVTLDERFADLAKRYAGRLTPQEEHDVKKLNKAVYDIQTQVMKQLDIKPEQITDAIIAPYRMEWSSTDFIISNTPFGSDEEKSGAGN